MTLDELLDEIGVDATRFFMLQRSHDRTIELDVELARKQSRENPVYYIQYAHARIASMLRRFPRRERSCRRLTADWDSVALEDPERDLIKKLVAFPGEVAEAVERGRRTGSRATRSSSPRTSPLSTRRVASSAPRREAVESQRVALSVAAQTTIALSLRAARRERPRLDVIVRAGKRSAAGGASNAHVFTGRPLTPELAELLVEPLRVSSRPARVRWPSAHVQPHASGAATAGA